MEDKELTHLRDLVRRARGHGLLRNLPGDEEALRWLDEALGPGGVGEDLVAAGLDLGKPYDRALVLALDSATGFSFDAREVKEPRDYAALVETFAAMTEGRCAVTDVEILDNEDTGAPEVVFKVDRLPVSYLPPESGSPFDQEGFLRAWHAALEGVGVAERFQPVPLKEGPEPRSSLPPGAGDGTLTVLFATPESWAKMVSEGFVPG